MTRPRQAAANWAPSGLNRKPAKPEDTGASNVAHSWPLSGFIRRMEFLLLAIARILPSEEKPRMPGCVPAPLRGIDRPTFHESTSQNRYSRLPPATSHLLSGLKAI